MRSPRPESPKLDAAALVRRARRLRRRGEHRRAMLILRDLAYSEATDARIWTLYGVACVRLGRREDGVEALKQAVWLRQRDHDDARARVTRALIACVLAGNDTFRLLTAA
jgi:Flp pilus assembly protein TadD